MSLILMGRKIGMTQIFDDEGSVCPISVISLDSCQLVGKKEFNGFVFGLVGYENVQKNVIKSKSGFFQKLSQESGEEIKPKRFLKQSLLKDDLKIGHVLDASYFQGAIKLDVSGVSKGKGFQGVVKRHGMAGGRASHGSRFHRAPGSVGAATFPARIWKGKKMPGHMGNQMVTVKRLSLIKADVENNLLLVKGAVPGGKRGLLYIRKSI